MTRRHLHGDATMATELARSAFNTVMGRPLRSVVDDIDRTKVMLDLINALADEVDALRVEVGTLRYLARLHEDYVEGLEAGE